MWRHAPSLAISLMKSLAIIFLAASSGSGIVSVDAALVKRQGGCAPNFTTCQPSGATATALPALGSSLAPLYPDLLNSVKGVGASSGKRKMMMMMMRRDFSPLVAVANIDRLLKRDDPGVCCADGTACLNIQDFNVPMCYDHFTTNFLLPDGTYGNLNSGDFHAADGSIANLIDGAYTSADGSTGNLYPSSSGLDTASLAVPTAFTSAGVGSAIPVTALGGLATYTITIPGTTLPPTTVPETTVTALTFSTTTVQTTLAEKATTVPGTTVPPKTLTLVSAAPPGKATSTAGAAPAVPSKAAIKVAGAAAAVVVAVAAAL